MDLDELTVWWPEVMATRHRMEAERERERQRVEERRRRMIGQGG